MKIFSVIFFLSATAFHARSAEARSTMQGVPITLALSRQSDSSLARLAKMAESAPSNAQAWNAFGRAASNATRTQWRRGVVDASSVRLIVAAETSLARAVRLAPENVEYSIDLATHLFGVSPTNITRAESILERALAIATKTGSGESLSRVADKLGIMQWRRYESLADRRGFTLEPRISLFLSQASEFAKWLELYTFPFKPPIGMDAYDTAEHYFQSACEADVNNDLALRHYFMALLDRNDWSALAEFARRRVGNAESQAWAWLGLGLAEHRLGHRQRSTEAFEKGLSLLTSEERTRLTEVSRILSIKESARYTAISDSLKSQFDTLFWNVGNPSYLIPGNIFRDEYLARVIYAELRWSNEEQTQKGSSSDRGDAYIRFGPPDIRASFKFDPDTAPNVIWAWSALKVHLFFKQAPLYGTAYLNPTYRSEMYEPVILSNPSYFGALAGIAPARDSIFVQAYRFRGRGDSTEIAVYAGLMSVEPDTAMSDSTDRTMIGLFALSRTGRALSQNVREIQTARRDSLKLVNFSWQLQVPPSISGLRVDALRERDHRVGRWLSDFSGALPSGFSLSDILVAERVNRRSDAIAVARWFDFDIKETARNVFSKKRPIDVLWETYDIKPVDSLSAYQVSINLTRKEGKSAGAVFARLIGGVANATGIITRTRDGINISYDRTTKSAAIQPELIRLDLSSAPIGKYQIKISVLDKSTGLTAVSVRNVELVN